ncbi:hypothetical protein [Deefgea salmonis]|uniref:Tyr recombinase domain-containing protein n=1 Tax=Deefgea salmonis TaxID=2875502 RepID=A0ABS8BL50_9NEIS|nr:hypothetical protein [Deefgea salmonis]MCB5196445.1 hypothetical protein [Deefgea salmonis]
MELLEALQAHETDPEIIRKAIAAERAGLIESAAGHILQSWYWQSIEELADKLALPDVANLAVSIQDAKSKRPEDNELDPTTVKRLLRSAPAMVNSSVVAPTKAKPNAKPLAELIPLYLESRKNPSDPKKRISDTTYDAIVLAMRSLSGKLDLEMLTSKPKLKGLAEVLLGELKSSTVEKRMGHIAMLTKWLTESYELEDLGLTKPLVTDPWRPEPNRISDDTAKQEAIAQLLSPTSKASPKALSSMLAGSPDFWLAGLMSLSGARINELTPLTVEDLKPDQIDPDVFWIHIHGVTKAAAKGERSVKNEASIRWIPIVDGRHNYHESFTLNGLTEFLTSRTARNRWSEGRLGKTLQSLGHTAHQYRHRLINLMKLSGVTDEVGKSISGHTESDKSVYTETYGHVAAQLKETTRDQQEAQIEALRVVDRYFNKNNNNL